MATKYTVQEGDCIYSISAQLGYLPDTIWKSPHNTALKTKRKDPLVLFAGDIVNIPDKRIKIASKTSGSKHSFRRRNSVVKLSIRLIANGKPRAYLSYVIEIEEKIIQGHTDGDGKIEHLISPLTTDGKLILPDTREEHILDIGYLDPVEEPTGIQARLRNLGLYEGRTEDAYNDELTVAIAAFQEEQSLTPSGKPDPVTLAKIVKIHGC